MTANWLASPPMALLLFAVLAAGAYFLAGRIAPRGSETPGKRQPYACGEDIPCPDDLRLSYRGFYRLALMFVTVHMATLVLAMLPSGADMRLVATAYLLTMTVCIDILSRGER